MPPNRHDAAAVPSANGLHVPVQTLDRPWQGKTLCWHNRSTPQMRRSPVQPNRALPALYTKHVYICLRERTDHVRAPLPHRYHPGRFWPLGIQACARDSRGAQRGRHLAPDLQRLLRALRAHGRGAHARRARRRPRLPLRGLRARVRCLPLRRCGQSLPSRLIHHT